MAYLHKCLACREETRCLRPGRAKNLAKLCILDVAAPQPEDPRRWPEAIDEACEIFILGDDDVGGGSPRSMENRRIVGASQSQILKMGCSHAELVAKPTCKGGRKLHIDPNTHDRQLGRLATQITIGHSRGEVRMIHPSGGIQEACRNIIGLEVREIRKDLLSRLPSSEQFEHVNDAHPHTTNARSSAALQRIDRDAFEEARRGRDNGHCPEKCSEGARKDSASVDSPRTCGQWPCNDAVGKA